MINPPSLERRYLFTGILGLESGVHVGSGWTVGSPSDNPVIRTPDGLPFIPGSSFKGAFRSTVEKLALATGLSTCALLEGQGCIGAQGHEQQGFNSRWQNRTRDSDYLAAVNQGLCDTCKLFGSPYVASRIIFADLMPHDADRLAASMIEIRDGVAIDRDSEKAVDRLKYDYEVVASAQTFQVSITLDSPTDTDLALTCLGVSEFVAGLGHVGGKRSRGLGACKIERLAIYEFDLTNTNGEGRAQRLRQYLLGKTPEEKMTLVPNASQFLEARIRTLPIFMEEHHA